MSTTFVVGASGYTGQHLVRLGASLGRSIVAHVRPGSSKEGAMRGLCSQHGALCEVLPFEGDSMRSCLNSYAPELVVACLGTTRRRAAQERGASYETVDYGLTKQVMNACLELSAPPRFVYLSALGAGRPTKNKYMSVRHRFENELRASGLPWTIARPAFISGSDREEARPLERLGATLGDACLGAAALVGARKVAAKYRSMSGASLAEALLRAALRDAEAGVNRVWEADALRGLLTG